MAQDYDPKEIEAKWQKEWEQKRPYDVREEGKKPKFYSLMEFPYPSGDGLHTGHVRGYTAMDIISRKRRMEGYNVMFPIGWDAFGLPTENYAIKTKRLPAEITKENTDKFRVQFRKLGMSFDWSREVNTTDPGYYKWTQWLFLKFLEHGLAYKAKMNINWCPKDKIGLANEEVVDGKCERCGTPVEQKEKEQWMLAITKYADKLLNDLDSVDYPERVKTQQRNWIGRSEGALVKFDDIEIFTTRPDTVFGATFVVVAGKEDKFTGKHVTNPATKEKIPVWEAEYVMADYGTGAIMAVPAHDERDYEFAKKHDLPIKHVVIPRRIDHKNPPQEGKEFVFRKAIIAVIRNPRDGKILTLKWKKQPWTTFVMGGMEEGENPVEAALREVKEETGYKNLKLIKELGGPTHTEFYAAHKGVNRIAHSQSLLFELVSEECDGISSEENEIHEIVWVSPEEITPETITHIETDILLEKMKSGNSVYTGEGIMINSGEFNMLPNLEARKKITEKFGKSKITYKLRDWVFSRQRYWGEPIPVVHCEKCAKQSGNGWVPVPEKDLPVLLPEVKNYQPTDTGESPLANISEWVNTTCPKCGGPAKRETDTMPNWAGSSWYFLAYCMDKAAFENAVSFENWKLQIENFSHFMPVDWYNGGMEHTVLHLLYSRFWNKFFFDIGLVPVSEPYKKRTSHGLILAQGGEKMSKSKGNVVNPDAIVESFGADTLRLYEMFMGPFEQAIEWSESALAGPRRFLEKVWKMAQKQMPSPAHGQAPGNSRPTASVPALMHQTIKKVSEDIDTMRFNTAVSAMMIYVNSLEKQKHVSAAEFETLLILLSPFAPYITEELWSLAGHNDSVHDQKWPGYDANLILGDEAVLAVQIDGKLRAKLTVPRASAEEEIRLQALALPEVKKWLGGKEPKKVIIVPGRVVSIIT
ncbi:MAG: class I tRNA ligase family protein [bacterium]|nr:class I tRNA ligase family protein [bacterium]